MGKAGVRVERQVWVEITEFRNDPAAYIQWYESSLKDDDQASALSALENHLVLFPRNPDHKKVEALARTLRVSLDKAQKSAWRAANAGKQSPSTISTQTVSTAVRTCIPEPSRQRVEASASRVARAVTTDVQAAIDLDEVLSRARTYVRDYEAQLGNLIGEEVYVQNETPIMAEHLGTMFPAGKASQRLTESDFIILRVGSDWVGVRNVRCADGRMVPHQTPAIEKILDDSPAATLQKIDNLQRENAIYNIGVIERNTNLPTTALEILRPDHFRRFEFNKTEETNFGGIRVWGIGYRETRGPAMIRDRSGHDLFTSGTLWIDPETGSVLKTEMNVAHTRWSLAQMIVSYKMDSLIGILLPVSMEEHYVAQGMKPTDGIRKIDCRADYFNFHRFQVETRLNFGPISTPPRP